MAELLKNSDELPTNLFLDNGAFLVGRSTGPETAGDVFFINRVQMAFFQNTVPVFIILYFGCTVIKQQQMIPALPEIEEEVKSGNFGYLPSGPEAFLVCRRNDPIIFSDNNLLVYGQGDFGRIP